MYAIMKNLIGKKYYKTKDEAQEKLDVFFAVGKLEPDKYTELTALVVEKYGE